MDPVVHPVALAGLAVEMPKTEQSIAQNSVFRSSAGLFDQLFSTFPYPAGNCNKRCCMMNFVKGLAT